MSIWNHKLIKDQLNEGSKSFTLNEGDTPTVQLNDSDNRLIIKREDKNPTGSWKDRGTAFKLSKLVELGVKEIVMASSGNAAISMLKYAELAKDLKVNIVLSPNADREKRKMLEELVANTQHELHYDEHAKKKLSQIAAEKKIPAIKSSLDEDVLKGYWSLGFELTQYFKRNNFENNFLIVPVSSGSALIGAMQGLQYKLDNELMLPRVVVVQTQSCHPIVDLVNKDRSETLSAEKSLADAIVDQSALRSPQILNVIDNTNGLALMITNDELETTKKFMQDKKVEDLSYTSLLSIAGYLKIKELFPKSQYVCIASGR